MQPRRIARELALLGISQLPTTPAKLGQKQLEDLVVAAIRALTEEAHDILSAAGGDVHRSDRLLHDTEHVLPVPQIEDAGADPSQVQPHQSQATMAQIQRIQKQLHQIELAIRAAESRPQSQQELLSMAQQAQQALVKAIQHLAQLDQRLQSARQILDEVITNSQTAINQLGSAITLPEFVHLAQTAEVKAYALQLLTSLHDHKTDVDQGIQAALVGWQLTRLNRMDRDILRVAVVEMQILQSVPTRIAINEAVELAKKYGNDESSAFVNGVLRRFVEQSREQSRQAQAIAAKPHSPDPIPPTQPHPSGSTAEKAPQPPMDPEAAEKTVHPSQAEAQT